jgi:Rrf2 family protein
MMFSQKCKYAIRTILYLASEVGEDKKVNIKDLSEALKIPTPYLGKILQELVPKNLISSNKGPNGGFFLTEKNKQAPLIHIIEAIDGLGVFTECGLGLEACSNDHPCPIHNDFKIARERLQARFSKKSIQELAKEINSKHFFLVR